MRFFILLVMWNCFLFSEESPYLPMNDLRLQSSSKYIEHRSFRTKELLSLGEKLRSIAKNEPSMVGLAAPQIGIFERVILVDMNAEKRREKRELAPNFQVFVNPQIVSRSQEREKDREGCFSTGPFVGIVSRAKTITLCAYTLEGELIVQEHSGYLARVFQHEIDHLDGIRFPDRLEKGDKLHIVTDEMRPAYKEQWMDWNITCDLDTWNTVKEGKEFKIPLFEGPEAVSEDTQNFSM